ncbi:MAG TPA: YihY/virulence factor BrkB family protein [Armatimonadota bacterium]|nr:YihY/virulence factor BrkB family protein [Armatimonadota bacterium]
MHGRKSWRQRWQDSFAFIKEVYYRFGEDRVSLAAGAITYFTLLSLFPLLLLAVTFAAQGFYAQLENLRSTLGPGIYNALQAQVISVVRNRGVSTVVAVVFGMWSGSQVFLIVESAMNLAWHATKKRPYWLRRGIGMLMVIIVGTLLIGAILLANLVRFLASLQLPLWGHRAVELPWLTTFLITIIIPTLLISAIFAVMYRVLPVKRVTFRTVIPGALIAGVLWLISLHVFGWYTANIARYQVFYGSLGGLVLLLIWFYYSAFTLLLGAEISAAYHRRLVEAGDRDERLVEESDGVIGTVEKPHGPSPSSMSTMQSMSYYGYQSEKYD